MSKIETIKHLPTPADLRKSVEQIKQTLDETVQRLDQTTSQVIDLSTLPELVANQTAEAIKPLLEIQEQVTQALQAYDQVNQAQRQAIGNLAKELSSQAGQAFSKKISKIDDAIRELTRQVAQADLAVSRMDTLPKALSACTDEIDTATGNLSTSAKELKAMQDKIRTKPWKIVALVLLSSLLSAVATHTGPTALSKLQQSVSAKISQSR